MQPELRDGVDKTTQAMKNPQPGDHFTEMYSFHVVVVAVDGDFIITAEGNGKFPQNAKFHRQTLDEFRRHFGYEGIPGYWIRLYRRGISVDGWLDRAVLLPRVSSRADRAERMHLRPHEADRLYQQISAQAREIEMLHGMIRRQKAQRDTLPAACKAVFDWSQTDEREPGGDFVHLAEVLVPMVEAAIRQAEPGPITVYDVTACAVCGVGFTPEEWEARHDGHEDGCPSKDNPDSNEVCECDLVYHAGCCPDCREDED